MASNAPAPPTPTPLAGMNRLSPVTYLHTPDAPADSSAPRLVVLLSWLGAQEPHIAKYVAGY